MRSRFVVVLLAQACLVGWQDELPKSDEVEETVDSDTVVSGDTDTAIEWEQVETDEPVDDPEDSDTPEEPPVDPGAPTSFSDGSRPANSCAIAMASDPVAPGHYTGSMEAYGNSGVHASCIGEATLGKDGWLKVAVPPAGFLTVRFRSQDSDAQIALVEDCQRPASTCLVGADERWVTFTEEFSYGNPTVEWQEAYIFLGTMHHDSNAGPFDLWITTF